MLLIEAEANAAPAVTFAHLTAFGGCEQDMKRVEMLLSRYGNVQIDAAMALAAGCTFDDIIWAAAELARSNKDVRRRLRLFAADCAARVLPIYERVGKSDDPRKAIIAARRAARREINVAELAVAQTAAWAAAWAVTPLASQQSAVEIAAERAARIAAWAAELRAARIAAWAAELAVAQTAEYQWQFDRLVAWLSAAEPMDWPLEDRK